MYLFNEEDIILKRAVKELCEGLIKPYVANGYRKEERSTVLAHLFRNGYKSLFVSPKYEGLGFDFVDGIHVVHELAKADAGLAHLIATTNIGFAYPIEVYGNNDLKEKYLPAYCRNMQIGTLIFNEPDGVSFHQINTTAEDCGAFYRLYGTKSLITEGKNASYGLVYALVTKEGKEVGESVLVVDLEDQDRILRAKEENIPGMKALEISDIVFDGMTVPKGNMLGKPGMGGEIISKIMEVMRIANSAIALGVSQVLFAEALEYMRIRQKSNRAMIELDTVKFSLAEMKIKIENMELCTFYGADRLDCTKKSRLEKSSIVKVICTNLAQEIAEQALRMFGGYGYIEECVVGRLYRDIKALYFLGGSEENIKTYIAYMLAE